MPGKKAKSTPAQPQLQEGQTQTALPADQNKVNQRLARIEEAIAKMATGPAPRVPSPTIMTTRGRAKKANAATTDTRRSLSADPLPARTKIGTSQSTSSGNSPKTIQQVVHSNHDTWLMGEKPSMYVPSAYLTAVQPTPTQNFSAVIRPDIHDHTIFR